MASWTANNAKKDARQGVQGRRREPPFSDALSEGDKRTLAFTFFAVSAFGDPASSRGRSPIPEKFLERNDLSADQERLLALISRSVTSVAQSTVLLAQASLILACSQATK